MRAHFNLSFAVLFLSAQTSPQKEKGSGAMLIIPMKIMLSIRVTLCIKGLILSIIMLALFAGVARADESPQRPH
jgi:hypothetical protein